MFDNQGRPYYLVYNPQTGENTPVKDRIVHLISNASPETRQQGDFTLSYDWDNAAASLGGGISTEPDYESRFVNLGGRLDFNQKQTALDIGLSYTNSDVDAKMHPDVAIYGGYSRPLP